MGLLLGDTAPNFDAVTNEGPISFHDWIGDNWVIFFSHPADFTPVCTTELGFTAKLKDEFAKRNAKAIALSVDSVEDHNKWIKDVEKTPKLVRNFTIIAETAKKNLELHRVELIGIYWHFVDIVWIFLFPLLYIAK